MAFNISCISLPVYFFYIQSWRIFIHFYTLIESILMIWNTKYKRNTFVLENASSDYPILLQLGALKNQNPVRVRSDLRPVITRVGSVWKFHVFPIRPTEKSENRGSNLASRKLNWKPILIFVKSNARKDWPYLWPAQNLWPQIRDSHSWRIRIRYAEHTLSFFDMKWKYRLLTFYGLILVQLMNCS